MYKPQFLSRRAENTLRGIAREGRKNGGVSITVYRAGTRLHVTSAKCMADPFMVAIDGETGIIDVEVVYIDGSRKSTLVDLDAMGCESFDSNSLPEGWFEQNEANIRRYMRG